MSTSKVLHYYSSFDEWSRLDTPAGILEFERTLAILTPHLQPHSHILDLGGGPGRYTIALAAIAFLPRLTGIAGLIARAAANPAQVPPAALEEAFTTGIFHNGTPTGFQEGYYAHPDEIRTLFAAQGFAELGLHSIRGLAAGQEDPLLRLKCSHPTLYAQFLSILAATAQDPAVISLGGHALYLGRKA